MMWLFNPLVLSLLFGVGMFWASQLRGALGVVLYIGGILSTLVVLAIALYAHS